MISRSHVFVVGVLRARVGAVCDDAVHAPAVLPHGAAVGRGCSHHIKEWAQYDYNAQAYKVRRRGYNFFFNFQSLHPCASSDIKLIFEI